MLFDDDFDDQELFGHALRHLAVSADFVTENDGVHAIEKHQSEINPNPHFIFVEMDTPKIAGVDCFVEIKKISAVKSRPVYLYSTYADPKTLRKSKLSRAVQIFKAHNMRELEKMLADKKPNQQDKA